MAKWGEGDPRWIVEERPDATNVNNWHWTEKNADSWSKAKIKELVTGAQYESHAGHVRLISLDRCEGEARVSSRKGKVLFMYDWSLVVAWEGTPCKGSALQGKLEVASFSDEHEDESEEVIVDVILSSRHEMGSAMGALAKRLLINQLVAYVSELKSVYSCGSLLPCKDGSPPTPKPTINQSPQTRLEPGKMKSTKVTEGEGNARQISKKPRKRKVKSGNSDILFYISLVSIVGISAVLVVRLVKAV